MKFKLCSKPVYRYKKVQLSVSKTFLFQFLEFETVHSGTLTANRVVAAHCAEGTGEYKPTHF